MKQIEDSLYWVYAGEKQNRAFGLLWQGTQQCANGEA